jgi:hypothetical protein
MKESFMGISPISNVRATYGTVGVAPSADTQQPAKNSNSTQPADSVQLSAKAKAQLGGDTDRDGDSK